MAAAAGTQAAAASASKPQSDTLDPQHKQQLDTGHRDTSSSLFSTHRHTRNLSDFSDIFLDTALSSAHTDAFKGEATLQPQASLDLQGERPTSAHILGDLSPFTSQLSPSDSVAGTHALSSANIEESFEQALLMGDQGAFSNGQSQGSPFPYDASGLGYNAMQSPPVGQQQVPQFSISQQNLDGTMTTTHTTADGAELAAASGARISRHASPFEVATAPMQPPTQPQLSPGLHFALGDPYANGLDVPSPYSDTASFVGSDVGDGGSPHLGILRLSRTNSMNSAFRPDLGYLYSHPPSPFIEHSDASASQPPPPLQPNHAQQSFAYLQPGASPHNATHMSPQMAQMSFNNQNSFTATPPVAIRLEQPSNAYGDYTPGISLNPPTPSGHATLDMSHHGGNTFNFIPGMPLITTSLHHHDDSHDTGGVSALERALQEQQQKQLDQLRQHHLQQQQTLLGVEDAARRGRSLSDSGMERYGPVPVRRDGSHGSARGRSRDGRSSHSHRGSSSGSHSPHTHGARRPSFNQGAFPGAASVAGATPGLLGSELRAHSPNPRSGSAGHIGVNTGPGGKHVRRSSWSGQRQGGLSPRDVSPSGSSVHSFVAGDNNQSAQQQQQPHAKAKNPATFICPVAGCNKAFTRAYNLRSHQRTHTNERPFLCEVCGKAFARQHDRKRHEALHSGVKAHACPGCNKKFARMDALSRHFKSETGKDCIEGREEYARYVDGQASAEQQDGYVDDENASQGMSASDLGLEFEGEGYAGLY